MSLDASAYAAVEDADGRPRYTRLHSQVPLSIRPTAGGLTIVGSAFGPLGGDRTNLEVELGERVVLAIGSTGAQVAQPGVRDPVSRAYVTLRAGPAARLSWQPQPLVVTEGAEHRQRLDVELAAGASALLVETIVLGAAGREPGRYRSRWRVSYDGQPLFASDLDVGAGAPAGWDGPAVLHGSRVLVNVLAAGPRLPDATERFPGGELLVLAGPGVLLTWQGRDTVTASRVVRAFLRAQTALSGSVV